MKSVNVLILAIILLFVNLMRAQDVETFSEKSEKTNESLGISFKKLLMDYQSQNGGSLGAIKDYHNGFEIGIVKNLGKNLYFNIPIKIGVVNSHAENVTNFRKSIYGIDAQLQYNFSNNERLINPYIVAGLGVVLEVEGEFNIQAPIGFGLNLRAMDRAFVNVQSEYRYSFKEGRNNLHHAIGFVYYFGNLSSDEKVQENKKDKIPELNIKDSDGDRIPDHLDLCPDEPGASELNGCPDRDGDGVPNFQDECPDQTGLKEFRGCPDTDGDGISDLYDECPKIPGIKANNGCPEEKKVAFPDRDGDGVPDIEDQCPEMPGIKELGGCPDKDGDGIPDHLDKCPEKAGPKIYSGCPDSDSDGIPDHEDRCPYVAGPVSNKGCPEIAVEDKKTLDIAMRSVQFETGKAILKPESYAILNQIASIVKRYPDFNLAISGHTDSTGSPVLNQSLSERRAKACYDYLISLGISKDRLSYVGFGDSRPIADNKTPIGRSLNRRVEFILIPK